MNLWNPALKNELVAANGSVQGLDIPMHLKQLYKTVWEIKQRILVDMAADRGAYIDQSQSFNVHMSDPNFGKLTSLHFHTWRKVGGVHKSIAVPFHLVSVYSQVHGGLAVPRKLAAVADCTRRRSCKS
jgi:ribonucleotide reductase alpha subunit